MLPLLGIHTKKSICYYWETCKSMFIAALFKFVTVSVSSSVVSGRYYILGVFCNATMYNVQKLYKFNIFNIPCTKAISFQCTKTVLVQCTMYKSCTSSIQKKYNTEKWKWTQSSTPRQEAICNVHLLRKEKLIFPYGVSLGVSNTHKAGLMSRNSWRTENGHLSFFSY